MKIGIIETGLLRDQLAANFPSYPKMFASLLRRADPDLTVATTSPVRGEALPDIASCDAWLIPGSRHGAYDGLDWFAPLETFIRDSVAVGKPLIGVCFGHQIIAQALGGKVVKTGHGWGVGVHRYRVNPAHAWMGAAPQQVDMFAFHQDQVVELPDGAEVFLSSDFCPYAGLSYGSSMISVQGHPEILADYETALLELYSGNIVPSDLAEQALDAMDAGAKPETDLLADWFIRFLRQAGA